jgi:pimeloyl-ACP methyl ester carboxylesterase
MQKTLLLLTILLCSSCMGKFVFTLMPKDITKHYTNTITKPTFKYIKTPVGKMYYATHGDSTKPILLLIHGAPGRWYSSLNLFDDTTLLQKYYIVSMDRMGYGKSNHYESITYIDAQVNAIATLIKKVNFTQQKVTVVGRSYGTPIAARIAMLFPNEIHKLFLLAPCIDPEKEKYFWFTYVNKIGIINYFLPKDLLTASDEKFAHAKELRKINNDWQYITAPTYVLQGRKDWIADTANTYFAKKKLVHANCKIYLLDNVGHNVTYSHFELIKQLLLQ